MFDNCLNHAGHGDGQGHHAGNFSLSKPPWVAHGQAYVVNVEAIAVDFLTRRGGECKGPPSRPPIAWKGRISFNNNEII